MINLIKRSDDAEHTQDLIIYNIIYKHFYCSIQFTKAKLKPNQPIKYVFIHILQ